MALGALRKQCAPRATQRLLVVFQLVVLAVLVWATMFGVGKIEPWSLLREGSLSDSHEVQLVDTVIGGGGVDGEGEEAEEAEGGGVRSGGGDGDGMQHSGSSVISGVTPLPLSHTEYRELQLLARIVEDSKRQHEKNVREARANAAAIDSAAACEARGGEPHSFNSCGGTSFCCGVCDGRKSCLSRQGWMLEGCACTAPSDDTTRVPNKAVQCATPGAATSATSPTPSTPPPDPLVSPLFTTTPINHLQCGPAVPRLSLVSSHTRRNASQSGSGVGGRGESVLVLSSLLGELSSQHIGISNFMFTMSMFG